MVESQATTPQATQVDTPENAVASNGGSGEKFGLVPTEQNGGLSPAMKEETPDLDKANQMDIDETIDPVDQPKAASIRRSPSVDMITSPPPTVESAAPSAAPAEEDIDSRVARIVELADQHPKEGETYYIIDSAWWKRFQAEASDFEPSKDDNFDVSKPVPPLDASKLIDGIELFPNGKTFPVLKQLRYIEDFEFVSKPIYEELVGWYGAAKGVPALPRDAINTADRTSLDKNVVVDFWPTVYTIFQISPSQTSFAGLGTSASKQVPLKLMTKKTDKFQEFLLQVKSELGAESMSNKARLWRFNPEQNIRVPATRRVDVSTFLEWEYGSTRELLDFPDHTPQVLTGKYNGSMTMIEAGISTDRYLIAEFEEDGEFPSERVAKALKMNGVDNIPVRVTKGTQVTTSLSSLKQVNKGRTVTTSTAPVTRSATAAATTTYSSGVMTRRDGRAAGAVGFSNLGNTCYMNSALQCIKSVEELSRYFIGNHHKKELNLDNPIGSRGRIATVYGQLIQSVYHSNVGASVPPREFKGAVGKHNATFSGYGQQDSQEFVSYLLDILHEDLNRIHKKPNFDVPDSTDEMINDQEAIRKLGEDNWSLYKKRNDSVIIDLFAGMYKSTVTCPVCDKISIKFDPWLSCQLQLPMENMWSRTVTFVPCFNSVSPYTGLLTIHVELEKHATIKQLKEFVGKRVGVEAKKMVVSEVFRNKFYKHHEDYRTASESIMPNDQIYIFEVDEIPSNFPPPKRKKPITRGYGGYGFTSMFATWEDEESEDDLEKTETRDLLVPVFNRLYKDTRRMGADLFGIPFFIVLNREEQKNEEAILKKIVKNMSKFTTSDMFSPDLSPKRPSPANGQINNDQDALEDEGEVVNIPAPKAESDSEGGPEDFVDVKMGDVESEVNVETATSVSTEEEDKISSELLRTWTGLFQLKIQHRKGQNVLPTGWNGIDTNLDAMSTRIVVPKPKPVQKAKKSSTSLLPHSPPASDSDADAEAETDNTGTADMLGDSDGETTEEDMPEAIELFGEQPKRIGAYGPISTSNFYGNGTSATAKAKNKKVLSKAGKRPAGLESVQGPLVRLGEGIVCDWNQDAFDAVFGGKAGDSLRGMGRFDASGEFFDEELLKKKKLREARRRRGVHINDCFDEFGREEILNDENQWYCPRCKEHRNAKKSMEIWRVPDIIALQFKRFSSTRSFRDKIDAQIEFPIEGLDLTGRVLADDGKSLIYDLIAVDNHFGGLGGGHYTANARNWVDNKWYYFDDSSARQTPPTSINGSAAYLVFYRRRTGTGTTLGGETLESILSSSPPLRLEQDEESPNGSGSLYGDPSISGTRYSSGLQVGSSASYYSGDGQRGGVGGITSSIKQPSTVASRGTASAGSFIGPTTPPPEKERGFQITSDDGNGFYSNSLTRPPTSSTTLFGSSPNAGPSSSTGFRAINNVGANYDFGASKSGYDGMDEGLDNDNDFDTDSHNGWKDSDDEDPTTSLMYGPRRMSLLGPADYYDEDSDIDNIPGTGEIDFLSLPTFGPIAQTHESVGRYSGIREEIHQALQSVPYAMTLVTKKGKQGQSKPCVIITTPNTEAPELLEVNQLCEVVDLDLEILEGEAVFTYNPVEAIDGSELNRLGTLIGPVDRPGKFSAISLYVRDRITSDKYTLTTASGFAQREPESLQDPNIPPRLLTTGLPAGSLVSQPHTTFQATLDDKNRYGTLSNVYELDIMSELGEEHMFNYVLIKADPNRVGDNSVTIRNATLPIMDELSIETLNPGEKVYITFPGGQVGESTFNGVPTDVNAMARFPGRTFRTWALISETRNLSTPGTLGSLCCVKRRDETLNDYLMATGVISGRVATTSNYASGSVLHFVQPVEYIFERIKEKFGLDLELL